MAREARGAIQTAHGCRSLAPTFLAFRTLIGEAHLDRRGISVRSTRGGSRCVIDDLNWGRGGFGGTEGVRRQLRGKMLEAAIPPPFVLLHPSFPLPFFGPLL